MPPKIIGVLLLCGTAAALQVFKPAEFVIRRQVGQLGVATETEWQYYGGQRNKLDASQPSRTVEAVSSLSLLVGEWHYGPRADALGERLLATPRALALGLLKSGQIPLKSRGRQAKHLATSRSPCPGSWAVCRAGLWRVRPALRRRAAWRGARAAQGVPRRGRVDRQQ